ncbi:MAG: arginase family protein [Lysobacter sp.]|nr:arginase family protein [Lysobacter sp.]
MHRRPDAHMLERDTPPGATLFGWPAAAAPHAGAAGIEVLGVPSDAGNGIASGARFGPAAIRRASLGLPARDVEGIGIDGGAIDRIEHAGIDHGDVDFIHDCDWADALLRIQALVEGIAARGAVPVVLGGDHAISYAAVAALHGAGPLSVVWFDAHTDFCAWPGGDWHSHKQVLRRIAGLPHVERIVQIGHRGITYDDESARSSKMRVSTAAEANAMRADALLDRLPSRQPVYISVDIDAVDPRWAPGTGHPVPGGLDVATLGALARAIAAGRDVLGVDAMEVNPLLDHRDMTSTAAASILAQIVSGLSERANAGRPALPPLPTA